MPDQSDKPEKQTPLPIQCANAALQMLLLEDSNLAESLIGILPAYAMKQAKNGIDMTAEELLAAARQGPDYFKAGRVESAQQKIYDYDTIALRLIEKYDDHIHYLKKVKCLQDAGQTGQSDLILQAIDSFTIESPTASDQRIYLATIALEAYQAANPTATNTKALIEDVFGEISKQALQSPYVSHKQRKSFSVESLIKKSGNRNVKNIDMMIFYQNSYPELFKKNEIIDQRHKDFTVHDLISLCRHAKTDSTLPQYLLSCWRSMDGYQMPYIRKNSIEKHDYDFAEKYSFMTAGEARYRDIAEQWKKATKEELIPGLEKYSPFLFKSKAYHAVIKWLRVEGYDEKSSIDYAYKASALFGSEQRLLEYIDRWGQPGKQPVHDLIQHIDIPAASRDLDLKSWSDALLKCGPSMSRLVKYADRLPQPLKSADGKTWSLVNTRKEIAKFSYNKAAANPELAAVCFEHHITEVVFNHALALTEANIPKKNLPDITIPGEKFDMPGSRFYRLADNDPRGLFLGEITDCCQSLGGNGYQCAIHGFSSENGGFYVVENAKGHIHAQTWAWRGEKDEMCFDSLETLGNNVKDRQWKSILTEVAKELNTRKNHTVKSLHVGLGGDTPLYIREAFKSTSEPAKPKNYNGYRDSRHQALVWKKEI